jgi:hypothetical protein
VVLVVLVYQGVLEQREHKDQQEVKDSKEHKVVKVSRDNRVILVQLVQEDPKVPLGLLE